MYAWLAGAAEARATAGRPLGGGLWRVIGEAERLDKLPQLVSSGRQLLCLGAHLLNLGAHLLSGRRDFLGRRAVLL